MTLTKDLLGFARLSTASAVPPELTSVSSGNSLRHLRKSELLREAEVVPARPFLGDPAVRDAENHESVDLGLATGLTVPGLHRHPRSEAIAVAQKITNVERRSLERVGVARQQLRELFAVAFLRARERMDVSAVVCREQAAQRRRVALRPGVVVAPQQARRTLVPPAQRKRKPECRRDRDRAREAPHPPGTIRSGGSTISFLPSNDASR